MTRLASVFFGGFVSAVVTLVGDFGFGWPAFVASFFGGAAATGGDCTVDGPAVVVAGSAAVSGNTDLLSLAALRCSNSSISESDGWCFPDAWGFSCSKEKMEGRSPEPAESPSVGEAAAA